VLEEICPGTCPWILDHEKVRWWLGCRGYSVLWMTGSPGMGKTHLAAYMIDTLRNDDTNPYTVLYSLCSNRQNKTLSRLLCVALHQLLEQNPELDAVAALERLNSSQSKPKDTVGCPRRSGRPTGCGPTPIRRQPPLDPGLGWSRNAPSPSPFRSSSSSSNPSSPAVSLSHPSGYEALSASATKILQFHSI
jgi:hypothetical protein